MVNNVFLFHLNQEGAPRFPLSQQILDLLAKHLQGGYIRRFGMGHVTLPDFEPVARFPLQQEDLERRPWASSSAFRRLCA